MQMVERVGVEVIENTSQEEVKDAAQAALGSLLGANLVNKDLLGSPTMRLLQAAFAGRSAPGYFGVNDPEALLAKCRWENAKATQPGEWGANFRVVTQPGSIPEEARLGGTVAQAAVEVVSAGAAMLIISGPPEDQAEAM